MKKITGIFVAGLLTCGSVLADTSTIVGSWLGGGGTNIALTFLSNGRFYFAQSGDETSGCTASGAPGVEYGTFSWNSDTGALSIQIDEDTTGDWGLSDFNGITVNVADDSLSMSETGGWAGTLTRVPDAGSALAGSWWHQEKELVLTFLADGTYFMAHGASGQHKFYADGEWWTRNTNTVGLLVRNSTGDEFDNYELRANCLHVDLDDNGSREKVMPCGIDPVTGDQSYYYGMEKGIYSYDGTTGRATANVCDTTYDGGLWQYDRDNAKWDGWDAPLTISADGNSWSWDFGDGETMTWKRVLASSPVTILPPIMAGSDFVLSFISQPDALHFVEYSTNLVDGPWMSATNFPGNGTTNQIVLPATNPATFYRIQTQ